MGEPSRTGASIFQAEEDIYSLLDGRVSSSDVRYQGGALLLLSLGKCLLDGFHGVGGEGRGPGSRNAADFSERTGR